MSKKEYVSVNSLSPEERKKLKGMISELNDSMVRVAAERDLQKEILTRANDDLGVDKKVVRRMAKAYFNSNYNEEVESNRTFEEFYENVVKGV